MIAQASGGSHPDRRGYPARYAREHGGFTLVPAAYVLLLDDHRVLLQRRAKTGYYDEFWAASAAGHVESGESVVGTALRETVEELGVAIDLGDLQPLTAMHRTAAPGLPVDQRVDFFFACRRWSGTPALQEDKASDLRWFELDALPADVVHHERFVIECLRDGALEPIMSFGF
jgi:8-oxo-dGTP diphosphatase